MSWLRGSLLRMAGKIPKSIPKVTCLIKIGRSHVLLLAREHLEQHIKVHTHFQTSSGLDTLRTSSAPLIRKGLFIKGSVDSPTQASTTIPMPVHSRKRFTLRK